MHEIGWAHSSVLKKISLIPSLVFGLAITLGSSPNHAAEPNTVLNLYSARHYQTDEALYANFTKSTGIKINRIEADDNALRSEEHTSELQSH